MAHFGSGVEYGLHCLLWLVEPMSCEPASSRDLADLQGISPSFLAKLLPKLEKAKILTASEGIRGGYRLSRSPAEITILDVIDAIEGRKSLFECQEIRKKCAVFGHTPPSWATRGVCAVHAVMLRAEKSMRNELAKTSIADVAETLNQKAPTGFSNEIQEWLSDRIDMRSRNRPAAKVRRRASKRIRSACGMLPK
jgi:Rrf2 family protein